MVFDLFLLGATIIVGDILISVLNLDVGHCSSKSSYSSHFDPIYATRIEVSNILFYQCVFWINFFIF